MHDEMKGYSALLPYFDAKLGTIDTNTLAEVLDYDSRLYKNYRHTAIVDGKEKVTSDTRWEEVACNVLGLMHTDHPYERPQPPHNPYADLKALGALAGKIQDMSEQVAQSCRERRWLDRVQVTRIQNGGPA
jgi:hypothetical protein